MKQKRIKEICDYLKKHFPDADHSNTDDFKRCGHKFTILTKDHVLQLSISGILFEDELTGSITSILDNHSVVDLMQKNPRSTIHVENSGVSITSRGN